MKKYSFYVLMALATASLLATSCKDDDKIEEIGGYNPERLHMPMFRTQQNTAVSGDEYGCGAASMFIASGTNMGSTHVNDMVLRWYGIEGASGYRLKGKLQGTQWDRDEVLDTILPPDQLAFLHEDLMYSQGYLYAIKALSPKGEAYDSKWYGYGDGSHGNDMSRDDGRGSGSLTYGSLTTGERYSVPSVFWVENVEKETMRVYFNTNVEGTWNDFMNAGAETADGKWVFDEIRIEPTTENIELPAITKKVTAQDLANGYVDFDGLTSNASYIVTGQNNNLARYYDRQYNKTFVRMRGDVGDPIKIEAIVDPNDTILAQAFVEGLQATRIDTVLMNYTKDNSMAEGQVFYLEGGKTYYTQSNVELTKGLTLETDPADIAAGKGRALVYLGVGYTSAEKIAGKTNNFMLSRNAANGSENGATLSIQAITINNINFSVQTFYNYMDKNGTGGDTKLSIAANYFMNMYSQGMSFSLSDLTVTNCTFSGMVRGFIRFQGPNRQIIQHMTVDNCVFYDCGVYDANGRGYSWFAGPGNNKNSNFFQNLTFTNNTLINCPRHALVSENGNLAWPEGTKWNINISNNTFINLSPRSTSSGHGLLLETRYAPAGSTVTIKKNLFVSVRKGDSDNRNLYTRGMRVDTKDMNYDIADNYATRVPAWGSYRASDDENPTTLTDGLFTNYAFSNTSSGAGYQRGALNVGGYEETQIKFGDNHNGNETDAVGYQLTPEELFKDPQPLGANGHKDMHRHNNDGFYYNNTARVQNHPIVTKKIGDQRWATGAAWK